MKVGIIAVIGNLRHENEKSYYFSRFLPKVEMTLKDVLTQNFAGFRRGEKILN
jgi:hypothetical protein